MGAAGDPGLHVATQATATGAGELTSDERADLQSALQALQGQVANLEAKMSEQESALKRVREELGGTSPAAPGIAMRLDRIERSQAKMAQGVGWILGGGGLSALVFLVVVWKILAALSELDTVG